MVLFCYAIALAARKLDDGNFEGLDRQTFLVQVEGLLEEGIKTLDFGGSSHCWRARSITDRNGTFPDRIS